MFNILNSYKDFYYPRQSTDSVESTRLVYCLHLLNHLFKTRKEVLRNNSKFKAQKDASLLVDDGGGDDEKIFRDQGFTHAKVLIVVPMRSSAFKIVQMIITLMSSDKVRVSNEDRFKSEYGSEGVEEVKKGFKPDDFEKTFDGNLDDNFKIGLSVCKKTLKLYVDFYASDVIITSPLGLKSVIDSKQSGETDFLSSIELVIIDQAHVFLMQNWSDVLNLVSSLNKQPQQSHGVKLSRVRMFCINGWSSLYRQTIIMSAYQTPEINSLFNKFSTNILSGRCMVQPAPTTGTICNIVNTLAQTFRKFAVDSVQLVNDARFNYFTNRIISEYRSSTCQHIMVFISSYYDFVRVRNFMKKEDFDFVHICEYTDEKDVSRARQSFFKGKVRFLLYTERFHFYHRYRIRGVHHIIFYDLPVNSHFYPELCNMMFDNKCNRSSIDQSCLVVYSRYDAIKLVGVVGDERASLMIQAHRDTHLLMSGDS
ncbi:hypothetical protein HELRODRAFT_102264 [Helobdella robusta]|uniref:U3 small nucleolar RNA-associated protein 25 homolog n=1 Tax=Helobdella robusta TaxID=6412 RepID=T1ED90_HELRO|nr:hypothetical protein HELRODRAFT_102264 [Helobdella robusta]ESN97087.1 hypothetical protein HELRODRAFT_102264 [Helobdella robusta]